MAEITSEARFQALKWKRGQGYYNANLHEQPYSWGDFSHGLQEFELSIRKRRYEAYIMSWILFHEEEPKAARLSERHGETILARVREMVAGETERRKDMRGAKAK